jgi:nifR3 family TIM-barrel protein
MCGITDYIFRTICYEQGCDLAYTEMISAMGYLCAPEQRATKELMIRGTDEPSLILQLFGRDPDIVAEAAGRITASGIYDGIDLNMGCPAKKIAPSGEGCGLMRTPKIAEQMMRRTVAASSVPVTVKMRLGYDRDHINVIDFARMAEDAGITSITVHGRTREQQYSGEADWEMIARVKQAVRIPVIGNGDVNSPESARAMMQETGCDAVMIGRAARGNPWIFRQILEADAQVSGKTTQMPDSSQAQSGLAPGSSRPERSGRALAGGRPDAVQLKETILRHAQMVVDMDGEYTGIRKMRKHVAWYTAGWPHSSRLRGLSNSISTMEDLRSLLTLLDP